MATCSTRLLRNICFGLYFFLLGVEYAVILPTLNGYLITLQADDTFLGIVLAAFSFAGLITAPLYGYFTDKTGSAKACIIVGNLLEVIGNFMYFVGRSKYFILGGRIIAGFGSGAASTVFGTVSRSTTEKERTSTFALFMALRQIGLLIGPGFNAFLYMLDFQLGPFVVNQDSSPGLFMAALWVLHTILFVVAFKGSDRNAIDGPLASESAGVVNGPLNISDDTGMQGSSQPIITKALLKSFLREEVVVVLASSFLAIFVQTGIEAALTPMTLMYFGWHGLENSYLLLAVGAIVMVSFGVLHFCSKYYADRMLLLLGSIGLSLGYAILLACVVTLYFSHSLYTPSWLFPVFCVDVFIWVVSLPYMFVPQVSLFSKITSARTQAFNQGVRMIALRIGMILGPLWASSMVTPARLPIMAGTNLVILLMLTAMVICSYKRLLAPPSVDHSVTDRTEYSESERSPLLNKV